MLLLIIMVAATVISLLFRQWGLHESNFIMTYLLGVILVANLTNGYVYSIFASVVGVLTFNYFFTVPYYSLMAYRSDYPVTFAVMLAVALITSTLTAQTKAANTRSEYREKRLQILYSAIRKMLIANNIHQVVKSGAKDIAQFMSASVFIAVADLNGVLTIRHQEGNDIKDSQESRIAYEEAFQSGNACGFGTGLFPDLPVYYFPICGQSGILGVIGVFVHGGENISDDTKTFLDTFGTQVALALERERLYAKQEKAKIDIEREHLRGNLLRALSHDLRTPLTGILGLVDTMQENYGSLPEEMKIAFLHDIATEAQWLSQLVENTLSLTKIDEGHVKINKELLPIEEIVGSAIERIKKRELNIQIHLDIPEEFIMIPVDGTLIEQILINLLDNAVQFSPNNPRIDVSVSIERDFAVFEIADYGVGIPEQEISLVFNRFHTTRREGSTKKNGVGLGLYVSKEIIKAHGGEISAGNRIGGGAIFKFTIPLKDG